MRFRDIGTGDFGRTNSFEALSSKFKPAGSKAASPSAIDHMLNSKPRMTLLHRDSPELDFLSQEYGLKPQPLLRQLGFLGKEEQTEFVLNEKNILNLMGITDQAQKEFFALLVKDMRNYSSFDLSFDAEANQRKEILVESISPEQLDYLENIAIFYNDQILDKKSPCFARALTTLSYIAKQFQRQDLVRSLESMLLAHEQRALVVKDESPLLMIEDAKHREDHALPSVDQVQKEALSLKPDTKLTPKLLKEFAGLTHKMKNLFDDVFSVSKLHNEGISAIAGDDQTLKEKLNIEGLKEAFALPELKLVFALVDLALKLDKKDSDQAQITLKENQALLIEALEKAQREDLIDLVFTALG